MRPSLPRGGVGATLRPSDHPRYLLYLQVEDGIDSSAVFWSCLAERVERIIAIEVSVMESGAPSGDGARIAWPVWNCASGAHSRARPATCIDTPDRGLAI